MAMFKKHGLASFGLIAVVFALSLFFGENCSLYAGDSGGKVTFDARSRVTAADDSSGFEIVSRKLVWDSKRTAVIVCDMWDQHWCKGATGRVGELIPTMNEFIGNARDRGMLIIHAPSSTMEHYANHPAPPTALSSIEGVVPERLQVTVPDVVADVSAVAVDADPSAAAGPPATRLITLVLRRARLASAVTQALIGEHC